MEHGEELAPGDVFVLGFGLDFLGHLDALLGLPALPLGRLPVLRQAYSIELLELGLAKGTRRLMLEWGGYGVGGMTGGWEGGL